MRDWKIVKIFINGIKFKIHRAQTLESLMKIYINHMNKKRKKWRGQLPKDYYVTFVHENGFKFKWEDLDTSLTLYDGMRMEAFKKGA